MVDYSERTGTVRALVRACVSNSNHDVLSRYYTSAYVPNTKYRSGNDTLYTDSATSEGNISITNPLHNHNYPTPGISTKAATDQHISSQANDQGRYQNGLQMVVDRISKIQANKTN